MKLGISGGLEYSELQSEIDRKKNMNGLRRCKAHDYLTEYTPCARCKEEGKSGEYFDFFLEKNIICPHCGQNWTEAGKCDCPREEK